MSKFKYQGRTEETVNKRIADRGGDYDQYLKVDPIKVGEGENTFRILPPTWDTKGEWGDNWAIDAYLHWDVGADKGTYLCLLKMKNEPCPICEMVADLDDPDLVKRLKAKRSLFAYIIDRKHEKEGPQIWRLGKQLEGNLQFRSKDRKTGAVLAIDHPERGYDILFTRVGTDEKTKYINEEVDRDSSFLNEDQKKEEKWLDYITDHPLPEQLNYYPYEHLAAVCKGRKSKKTSDDDQPSRSRRRSEPEEEEDTRGSRRSRASAKDEEEDRPARRRSEPEEESPRRRRSEPDPEEESPRSRRGADEDEKESPRRDRSADDDEPAPRRRSREPEEEEPQSRRRPSRDDPEDEKPKGRERERPKADDDEPAPRGRAHRAKDEEDDEIPSERTRRSAPKADEDEGEEEPEDEPKGKTTDKAKASLTRLRPK